MPFRDRRDAGRQLARLCEDYRGADTLVLGLARGGVPVAFEVAEHLGAPLDVMVARKIGAPGQPEFGIGAVAPGVRIVDARSQAAVGATTEEVDQIAADEAEEMGRRFLAYRGEAAPPHVRGRTVILVDDGLATGVTARAAVASLRRQAPRRIVLAVPVGAPETADALFGEVDDLRVLETPADFRAVGLWYDSFEPTRDEEVVRLLAEARPGAGGQQPVAIPVGDLLLSADLTLPPHAVGLVVFAHGSGSGRWSPRNRSVADRLNRAGLATLLLDLLTPEEQAVDEATRELRFDVPRLADRLVAAIGWSLAQRPDLPLGAFGASTGAAAALVAAARRPGLVGAVVSRGGRVDLAGAALPLVRAPTLLLLGERDVEVRALNEEARREMRCEVELAVVPGAAHLFEEPGALDEVAERAAAWFRAKLAPDAGGRLVRNA
jgi:putative phosphoribosyl transferase